MRKVFLVVIVGMFLAGCGKDANIFKFAHKSGGSSDKGSLLNDGAIALQEKNYSDALKYYNQVLAKDPGNAEALYGYSQARLNSVLPIGDLISRAIQDNAVPRPVLYSIINAAAQPQAASSASFLPETLDYLAIKLAVDDVIVKLRKIVRGQTDGAIPPDDVDVLINLTLCIVISYVIHVVDTDLDGNINDDPDDLVTITDSYDVVINVGTLAPEDKTDLKARLDSLYNVINNEVLGYLDSIILKIKAASGSVIDDLRTDITGDLKGAIEDAKDEIDILPEP